jgi:hypothetical protein
MEYGHDQAIALPYLTSSLGFLIRGYHEPNVLGNSATGVMGRPDVGDSGLHVNDSEVLSANPEVVSGLGMPALVSAV